MDAFKVEVSVTPDRERSFPLTRPNLRRDAWIRFSVAINSFSTADQFFLLERGLEFTSVTID